MKVLVACECSGVVRDEFIRLGHDAWSCDLAPAEESPHADRHFQRNVFDIIGLVEWDLMICHPPCRYLSVSGLHWNKRRPERAKRTKEALSFALRLARAPIPHIAMENPVSCLSTQFRKPDQIIQPYEFGDDASKKTCLWLSGLPKLPVDPLKRYPGRMVKDPRTGKFVERWSNQTDSGQNRLGPSPTRAADRARTYPGIAKAMAETWSDYLHAKMRT